jgi:hypothetical protein
LMHSFLLLMNVSSKKKSADLFCIAYNHLLFSHSCFSLPEICQPLNFSIHTGPFTVPTMLMDQPPCPNLFCSKTGARTCSQMGCLCVFDLIVWPRIRVKVCHKHYIRWPWITRNGPCFDSSGRAC